MALPLCERMAPLGLPVVPEVYIKRPRILGRHGDGRRASLAAANQILIGAIAGMAAFATEDDEFVGSNGQRVAEWLHRIDQLVLHNDGAGLAILDDVTDLGAKQPEIDRHGDQARQRRCGIDFEPFDAVIGKDANSVALGQAETINALARRQERSYQARKVIARSRSRAPILSGNV